MDPKGRLRAATSGMPVDPISFIKRPQVILRLVSMILTIIVMSSVNRWCSIERCHSDFIYHLTIGAGVLSFIGLLVFLLVEAFFNKVSNIKWKRHLLLGDLAFSGFFSFISFIVFIVLAYTWSTNTNKNYEEASTDARMAIFFAFIAITLFGGLTFFSLQRFRLGVDSPFVNDHDPHAMSMGSDGTAAPYSSGYVDSNQAYGQDFSDQQISGNQQYYNTTY